jgi:hypothetical protein
MITSKEHKQIIEKNAGNSDKIYRALIQLGTNLTETELKQLVMPDYNTLLDLVEEHYGQPSSYWFEKAERVPDDNVSELMLLHPQGSLKTLKFTFPTLAVMDVMESHDKEDQDAFIKMSCTGLGKEELESLSISDAKMLDIKVNNFLSQTASFFLGKVTVKP